MEDNNLGIHVLGVVLIAGTFVLGALRPVNIGVLALLSVFILGLASGNASDKFMLAGFPADLLVLLVGVTYLFGVASKNGTVDWLVTYLVKRLGGRVAAIPWLTFFVAALPSSAGALGPAAVGMLAPLCLNLGDRYGIDRRMSALMVMHGSAVGNFSPLNALAIILRNAAESAGFVVPSLTLFLANAACNIALAVFIYFYFGGCSIIARDSTRDGHSSAVAEDQTMAVSTHGSHLPPLHPDQLTTLIAFLTVVVGGLVMGLDLGFLALGAGAVVQICFPSQTEHAEKSIVWPIVLMICGVVTLVSVLESNGTIEVLGGSIASLGVPFSAALLLCFLAAITSAVGSSAGLIAVMVPLAAPFLSQSHFSATGLIIAIAISATVVDSSPFSSVGAVTVAAAKEGDRPALFQAAFRWGILMVVTAPFFTCLPLLLI